MNLETALLPAFVIQMEPELSTATAVGLLSKPKPALGDMGKVRRLQPQSAHSGWLAAFGRAWESVYTGCRLSRQEGA
jgi:hypothetical protein